MNRDGDDHSDVLLDGTTAQRLSSVSIAIRRVLEGSHGAETLLDDVDDPDATLSSEQASPLTRCALFSTLPGDLSARLEGAMQPCRFAPGQALIEQGRQAVGLYLLTSGRAEVLLEDRQGNRNWIDDTRPGEVVGEMSLVTSEPCSAHVIATEPCEALHLDAGQYHQMARDYPDLSVVLTHVIAGRLGRRTRDVLVGKELGGYLIQKRLDRGGMSVVYQAVQSPSGRQVALKMLSHRLVYDAAARERFHREAEVVREFDHPSICRVWDRFSAFHTEFLVMEFCEGSTLRDQLELLRLLPPARAKRLLGRLSLALAYAHQRGIVHRDVKPANVMLGEDDAVKLLDFGVACSVAGTVSDQRLFIAGTPRYMAPEQLAGYAITHQCDYFALGLLAFEMVVGDCFFPGTKFRSLIAAHMQLSESLLEDRWRQIRDEQLRAFVRNTIRINPQDRHIDWPLMHQWAS